LNIKVLIVCSGNTQENEIFDFKLHHAFIYEQTEELKKRNVDFDFFYIRGKGITGYIKNYRKYLKIIKTCRPAIVHAHYGLSGLFANLQRKVPVITTFHGSDVFLFRKNLLLSRIANRLSCRSIVVNKNMSILLKDFLKIDIIPCGVDLKRLYPLNVRDDINIYGIVREKINILFSSRFDYYEKNYPLAEKVMSLLGPDYNLVELKGYSREEVNLLMNICDIALMTSISEASPQFIKESMACNCPVVSTDVGDVKEIFGDLNGCFITSFKPEDVANNIKSAIEYRKSNRYTKGRDRIFELGLDSETVALKIFEVYKKVLSIND
jgi:glycosyltransferase involved in cell wall biosynthesis